MLVAAAVAVVAFVPPSAHAAARGSVNPQIAGLQVALRAWGLYNGPVDDISGPLKAAGLHAFQRAHGLPAGVADPKTRVRLGPLGRPLFGSRLLNRGCFGWDVSVLQFVLHRDGWYRGALDGYFDKTTEVALRRYQRHTRLVADGIAGQRTPQTIALRERAGSRRPVPSSPRIVYVVRSGDSLTSIAPLRDHRRRALALANHLTRSVLLIGKRLRIPAAQSSSHTPSGALTARHVVEAASASTRASCARSHGWNPGTRRISSRTPVPAVSCSCLPSTRLRRDDAPRQADPAHGQRRRRGGRPPDPAPSAALPRQREPGARPRGTRARRGAHGRRLQGDAAVRRRCPRT